MAKKENDFMKGSTNERKLRAGICMIGALLLLCALIAYANFFLSLNSSEDFWLESAFITDEVERSPNTFSDEKKAAR